MAPLIEAQNLQIRFGAGEAVRGIDFHVDDGEVLGLVGESGSGKSARALAILGLLGPTANVTGRILWRAKESHSPAADLLEQTPSSLRGCEIAMIFQEPMTAFNPVMTIGRQVAECASGCLRTKTRPPLGRPRGGEPRLYM